MKNWKIRTQRYAVLAAVVLSPLLAQAEDAQARLMRTVHRNLFQQLELCTLHGRIALALPQDRAQEKSESISELATCIAEGKADAEKANTMFAQWYKVKPAPTAMATWRTTWQTTYDDAGVRDSDTELSYLRRATDSLKRADKVSTKFQIAVLGYALK